MDNLAEMEHEEARLRRVVALEETRFLMQRYAATLLDQLEADQVAALDAPTSEALQVACAYVLPDLALRIMACLQTARRRASAGSAGAADRAADRAAESGSVPADRTGGQTGGSAEGDADDARQTAGRRAIADGQSALVDELSPLPDRLEPGTPDAARLTPGRATRGPGDARRAEAVAADGGTGGSRPEDLPGSLPEGRAEEQAEGRAESERDGHEVEPDKGPDRDPDEDPEELLAEVPEQLTPDELTALLASEGEDDELAGVLFERNIYFRSETAGQTPEQHEPAAGDEVRAGERRRGQPRELAPAARAQPGKQRALPRVEERPQRDTPGFVPTVGHERRQRRGLVPGARPAPLKPPGDTPGSTRGGTPTREQEPDAARGTAPGPRGESGEARGGVAHVAGGEVAARRADDAPKPRPAAEQGQQGKPAPAGEPGGGASLSDLFERRGNASTQSADRGLLGPVPGEAPTLGTGGGRRPLPAGHTAASDADSAREREDKARAQLDRQRDEHDDQRRAREEHLEEQDDTADLLDGIEHTISLDDLELYLEIRIAPDDRVRLDRRLHQKLQDGNVRSMLSHARQTDLTYAMVPRLPRLFRGGAEVHVTASCLVHCFPHLLQNFQEVILRYRTEEFYDSEKPRLEWAIVTTEALKSSLGGPYGQQRQALQQYAAEFHANEMRLTRRTLVEALWDLVVVKLVTGQRMLGKTVELTETKVGRDSLALINYGRDGIRISDISRQNGHHGLGVCPCW